MSRVGLLSFELMRVVGDRCQERTITWGGGVSRGDCSMRPSSSCCGGGGGGSGCSMMCFYLGLCLSGV